MKQPSGVHQSKRKRKGRDRRKKERKNNH